MTSPGPLFVDIIANVLRSYTESHISKDKTVGGMFLGNEPPISPDIFRSRCEELIPLYKPNSWDNFADIVLVVNSAVATYTQYYKAWINSPLESGAPPDVVEWYNQVRVLAGIA